MQSRAKVGVAQGEEHGDTVLEVAHVFRTVVRVAWILVDSRGLPVTGSVFFKDTDWKNGLPQVKVEPCAGPANNRSRYSSTWASPAASARAGGVAVQDRTFARDGGGRAYKESLLVGKL